MNPSEKQKDGTNGEITRGPTRAHKNKEERTDSSQIRHKKDQSEIRHKRAYQKKDIKEPTTDERAYYMNTLGCFECPWKSQ
jgi:hypothetical protein